MQNVTCGARPDRTLMPFHWADRNKGPATTLFQTHRCGGQALGQWCLSFGEKHLSDPPIPSLLPVYLNGSNRLLSEYWMLPSPLVVSTLQLPREMEAWKARTTYCLLSHSRCAQHWTRLDVSSANTSLGGIPASSSWLPSQGPASPTKSQLPHSYSMSTPL